jgi:predicted Zn-dependent protease with MMP-like domain
MTDAERQRFDALLEQVMRDLPMSVRELFDEAPLIIEDRPTKSILREFGLDPDDDTLCGLYSGTPMTDRSVDGAPLTPDHIYIFREGIVQQAGGWDLCEDEEGNPMGGEEEVAEEIRITVLHELGHHFGLDEEDLMQMGYD